MSDRLNLAQYRETPDEIARTRDLVSLVPKNRRTVLDIGARDGHFSRILAEYFEVVTALDVVKPNFRFEHVDTVQGDVTDLQYADNTFDVVFCTEVLEHILALEKACAEIARVARYEVVIGVPYRQETRIGRTTCDHCGKCNPPWGHINVFDEQRLQRLFPRLSTVTTSFVGSTRESTNWMATRLMDFAGNPWGVYEQEESCIYCGEHMRPSSGRSLLQKISAAASVRLTLLQTRLASPHANWIHVVLRKENV